MPSLGRYELLRPLARGGMADVYLARRRVGGVEKRLVIKRLRRDRHRDPRFLDMFVREAQLSMSLVQQNIVPVFDFGRIGDDVFLAMEHIDGKDLGSSLAKQRGVGLSPMLAAFVAAECCQALDHAHRRKEPVIHRDVTPRNVLLSWDGEVKLADFGIAAVVGEASGTMFGTPGYMSPEQANGLTVDTRGDVYALGLVLWESLTGEHVRPVAERGAALAIARTGELPALPETIPEQLATIIRRATAREPEARYASAREMADAIDAFMVAERSREAGLTPSKRLAAWLIERWGDDREEALAAETPAAAGAIVTFLDDGAAGVRGTHTQRSIAETAGDDADGEKSTTIPTTGPIPTSRPPPISTSGQIAAVRLESTPTRARRAIVAAIAVAGLAVAAYFFAIRDRGGASAPRDSQIIANVTPDAPAPVADADAEPADADVPRDAALIDAEIPIDAPLVRVVPRVDAGAGSAAKPAVVLRPIRINALPWAYFTVDDDPKQYETPTMLELSLGPHRITFTNPQLGVSRTVTVTVPAEGEARHVEKMN